MVIKETSLFSKNIFYLKNKYKKTCTLFPVR